VTRRGQQRTGVRLKDNVQQPPSVSDRILVVYRGSSCMGRLGKPAVRSSWPESQDLPARPGRPVPPSPLGNSFTSKTSSSRGGTQLGGLPASPHR
jgi:hypothetical protein